MLVAVGTGGRTMRSLDGGLTWVDDQQLIANGGDDYYGLRTVAYGGGQFVALGWRVMTSPDGKTWTDHGVRNNWTGAVRYQVDHFVAVGGWGQRMTSPDGLTWTEFPLDTNETHPHDALACTATACVSINDLGGISYSTNGTDWKYATQTCPTATYDLCHVAYGAGGFVIASSNSLLRSIDNGVTWTKVGTLSKPAGGIIYAENHFTVTANNHAWTSTDGTNWTDDASNTVQAGYLTYGDGAYVSLGWLEVGRSTDGIDNWGWSSLGNDNSMNAIAYGPLP